MSDAFHSVTREDLNKALEEVLFDELAGILDARQPGHCMKVTDLDAEVMRVLCRRLREVIPDGLIYILSREVVREDPLSATSTKIVELRNPLPDGSLRPSLLVFVPNDLRTSSEDSFGVATFEEIRLGHTYEVLKQRLIDSLPVALRSNVSEVLRQITERGWRWADLMAQVRYLLTLKLNSPDEEVAGAALYELGMVPDLKLVEGGTVSIGRLIWHLQCLETLTFSQQSERGRVLELGLKDQDFRSGLAEFLMEAGLEDPLVWTRRVLSEGGKERRFWFDRWSFDDGGVVPQQICIEVGDLVLPLVGEEEQDAKLQSLAGQQVLTTGPQGQKKLTVVFRTNPIPSQVQGLARFQLQIMTKEGMPVGVTKKKSVPRSAQQQFRVTFTKLDRIDWEEGWYFVRVSGYTEDGDPFPLIDAEGNSLPFAGFGGGERTDRMPNESDLFYVIPGDEIEVEPPQRAIPRYSSLAHAVIHLHFSAFSAGREPGSISAPQVAWAKDPESHGRKQNDMLQARFGREGLVSIPVSHALRILEQRVLKSPKDPISWILRIAGGTAEEATNGLCGWPETEEIARFLESRQRFFTALSTQHEGTISQSADFSRLHTEIAEYASSYVQVLQSFLRKAETAEEDQLQGVLQDLQKVLVVDGINLAFTNHRGERKTAALVSPTHPLRALWLVTWVKVAEKWLAEAKDGERDHILPTRDALVQELGLLNFPAVLPVEGGHLYVGVDDVHPFWTLYAPPGEEDPQGLAGEVCAALGLPEPAAGSFFIHGQYLADRIRRYLIQHPYIDTLTINAFNIGRGRILADMLLALQRRAELGELKYNVRLFVPDPDLPEVGQGVEELLIPGSQTTAQEADAFCTPTGNHLFPKLSLALRSLEDFRSSPGEYNAHITVLFDAFPPQEIAATPSRPEDEAAPIHGLFQDFDVTYSDCEEEIGWHRHPRHGIAKSLPEAEELTDLLGRMPALLSNAAAVVATGLVGPRLLPVIRLFLSPADKALIHQVHETSDWVFTIDRNMGIEFFDHDGSGDRPEYLIDHSPQINSSGGRRMVITSRSLAELEAMLSTVLREYNLNIDEGRAAAVLSQLRSLSGRLALKLISSPTSRAEALGLALARMYLDYQGAIKNQVIVPLDAHLDLYQVLQRNADDLGDEVSLRRTDLALFDLDASSRVITCRLVEVKCYRQVGDFGAFQQLMDGIAEQIYQSERILQYHFDPNRLPNDRPDRLIKVQEFVRLIEFYLERTTRFGLITTGVWNEAKYLLRTLEEGYRLNFTRSAIIFDFGKQGTEVTVDYNGIEYHRLGSDLIRELLTVLPARGEVSSVPAIAETLDVPQPAKKPDEWVRKLDSTVPKLSKAAFLAVKRDHTVSWESAHRISVPTAKFSPEDEPEGTVPSPRHEPPAKPSDVLETEQNKRQAELQGTHPPPAQVEQALPSSAQEPPVEQQPTAIATSGKLACDILLGDTTPSQQFGVLGKVVGRTVGLDLNHPQTISLFGVQGGGKSYTLGTIVEMATMAIPQINALESPLASVIFHYSPTQDYAPEFTSMGEPNPDPRAVELLQDEYGGKPQALSDVVLLTPTDKLAQRKLEYPHLEVRPLKFASSELGASHWRFLMGAIGNQATYFRQLNRLMRQMRGELSLEALRTGIAESSLPDHIKELADMRLDLAAAYIDDSHTLGDALRPGRMVIVDLRDEFIEKDEALGLFVVLLQLFADAKYEGRNFNKLIVFDEAHKYIDSPDLVDGLVEVVREMRHKGTTILVASQDPPSVPVSLIELSTQVIMHKFNSPQWLKHIQRANASLSSLTAEHMANLNPGEAYVWSSKATDTAFSRGTVKIVCRPRVTRHGGATRTAI